MKDAHRGIGSRLLAVFLSFTLVMSSTPVQSFALDGDSQDGEAGSTIEQVEDSGTSDTSSDGVTSDGSVEDDQTEQVVEVDGISSIQQQGETTTDSTVSADARDEEDPSSVELSPQSTILASGKIPNMTGLSWSIDSNYALSITGTGKLAFSWEMNDAPWKNANGTNYQSKIRSVSIASTVEIHSLGDSLENCTSLTSIDASHWTISNDSVDFYDAFKGCTALKTADVTNLVKSNVTSVASMFFGCSSLTSVTGLNTWDTSGCRGFSNIFYRCTSLKTIDFSSFDCSAAQYMMFPFPEDGSLSEIKFGPKWKFRGSKETDNQYIPTELGSYLSTPISWKNDSGNVYKGPDLINSWSSSMAGTYQRYTFVISSTNTVAGQVLAVIGNDTRSWGYSGTSGTFAATGGQDVVLNIHPSYGYGVKDVVLDGVSKGSVTSVKLTSISADHTIAVTFAKMAGVASFLITSTVNGYGGYFFQGGSITAYPPGSNIDIAVKVVTGNRLKSLTVDGVVVDTVYDNSIHAYTYTLKNIQADHTIVATFEKTSATEYSITSSCDTGGSISPEGTTTVTSGSSKTYSITPESGYSISTVVVDGKNVGAVDTYTFPNVTANHTISATFKKNSSGKLTRFAGDRALDTMQQIVDSSFTATHGTVLLATSDGYWDALTAAGLAGFSSAPVLLTSSTSLSSQTQAELKRLKPTTIIVCGGTMAIADNVVTAAKQASGATTVERCAGQDATGTACEIFKKSSGWTNTAFIATNQGYWDALSIAPYAYAKHCPIFLTEGSSQITDETISTMKNGGITKVYILGGTGAISSDVEGQLKAAGITVSGRLWGQNAIGTSEKVAEFELANGMKADGLALATNDGYWDALSGAALCGRRNSVLLLVSDSDRTCIDTIVVNNRSSIKNAFVFGGTLAVSSDTESYLRGKLGW